MELSFINSDWCDIYFVDGHADLSEFSAALAIETDADRFPAPKHGYFRSCSKSDLTECVDDDEEEGADDWLMVCDADAQDAFPVTYVRRDT